MCEAPAGRFRRGLAVVRFPALCTVLPGSWWDVRYPSGYRGSDTAMWFEKLRHNPVLLDFVERAGWSAGQVFFATLLAGGTTVSVANLPWAYALTISASAALASVLLTALQYLTRTTNLSFWPDVAVRLGKTFIASLLASIATAGVFNAITFDWTTALNIAFVTTLTALGKGLLAREKNPATVAGNESITIPAQPVPNGSSPSTLSRVVYERAISRR